jgi:hypothetical protein
MASTQTSDVTYDELAAHLGEGFHTAFRKATDCSQAWQIHRLIDNMPPREWRAVIEFVADALAPVLGISTEDGEIEEDAKDSG